MSLIIKKYGEEEEDKFSIIVNMERGEIEIYQEKNIVETIEDELFDISINDVKKVDKTLNVGEIYVDIINLDIFGRRLISCVYGRLNEWFCSDIQTTVFTQALQLANARFIVDQTI